MSLLSEVRRRALLKGLLGGSKPWMILGLVAWTFRALQWALRPAPPTVYQEKLGLGESLILRHQPAPPTRRQRRKSRRTEKRLKRRSDRADRRA